MSKTALVIVILLVMALLGGVFYMALTTDSNSTPKASSRTPGKPGGGSSGRGMKPGFGSLPRMVKGDQPEKPAVELIPMVKVGHYGDVKSIDVTSDGKFLLSGSQDHSAILWDIGSGMPVREYPFSDDVHAVEISPDGSTALISLGSHEVLHLNLVSGHVLRKIVDFELASHHLAFSPDGKRCLTSDLGFVHYWDLESEKLLRSVGKINENITDLVLLPEEESVLTATDGGTVTLWDLKSGKELQVLSGSEPVLSLDYSPSTGQMLNSSENKTISLWDLKTEKVLKTFHEEKGRVHTVKWVKEGKSFISCSYDGQVLLWNVDQEKPLKQIKEEWKSFQSLALSPDRQMAWISTGENDIIQWELENGKKTDPFDDDLQRDSPGIFFSPDGSILATEPQFRHPLIWNTKTGHPLNQGDSLKEIREIGPILPDNRTLVNASDQNTPALWDLESGKNLHTFQDGHKDFIMSQALSSDGKTFLTCSLRGEVIAWDLVTRKKLHSVKPFGEGVYLVAISPNGKAALLMTEKLTLCLWDLKTNKVIQSFRGFDRLHGNAPASIVFSKEGTEFLTGFYTGVIQTWDLKTWKVVRTVKSENTDDMSQTFSPDRNRMLSFRKEDHDTVILRDVKTGRILQRLSGHPGQVESAKFSPDERTAVSEGTDGTIRFWDLKTGKELARLHGFSEDTWLLLTSEGEFDGAGNLEKHLSYVRTDSLEMVPLKEVREKFERKGLLATILHRKQTK